MQSNSPSQPSETPSYASGTHRKRVTTTDLMGGGHKLVLLHAGQEYILRITKTGKLILTK
jgi:hemin uptake protein HemP